MTKTQHYLLKLREKFDLPNSNRVALHLGTSRAAVSRWMAGDQGFSDDIAIKVAEMLGEDTGVILAEMQEERSQNEEVKQAWRKLLGNLQAASKSAAKPIEAVRNW